MAELKMKRYFQNLSKTYDETRMLEMAKEANMEILEEHSQAMYQELQQTTPVQSGGLKRSLIFTEYDNPKEPTRVGYVVAYNDYDEKDRPYPLIANALNLGWKLKHGSRLDEIAGIHNVEQAKLHLRDMNEEIDKNLLEKIDKDVKKNTGGN